MSPQSTIWSVHVDGQGDEQGQQGRWNKGYTAATVDLQWTIGHEWSQNLWMLRELARSVPCVESSTMATEPAPDPGLCS